MAIHAHTTAVSGSDPQRLPSRRALLAAPVALMAVAAPQIGGAAVSPDAELIALCRRYLAHRAEMNRLFELQCAAENAGGWESARPLLEQQRAMVPALHDMEDEIAALPAHTAEGLRIKAEAIMSRVNYELDGSVCREDQLLHTLCRDILAGGEA